jgi:hypothetical protein
MSIRKKSILAVPLLVLFGAGCLTEVTQESSDAFVRAAFDTGEPGVRAAVIPTPNDLALQAAPSQPPGATRSALFAIIGNGGFEPTTATTGIGPLSAINIPYELVVDGFPSLPPPIDPTTINTTTVAIVRVSGAGAPEFLTPLFVGSTATATARAFQMLPSPGVYAPATRYVVAVRGGANGVKTVDGRPFSASTPIFLITNDINLSDPDSRPSTVTDAQAASLLQLKALYSSIPQAPPAGVDWGVPAVPAGATREGACRQILSIPTSVPLPEQTCWVPLVTGVPGAPGTPAARSVFAAVTERFPITEAASLQNFEIRP